MIEPTNGRVVNYWPGAGDTLAHDGKQPCAAHIAFVHSNSMVNLMVIDANGGTHAVTSVLLLQDGAAAPIVGSSYCEWMPYQKGQAAKTDSLGAPLGVANQPKAQLAPTTSAPAPIVDGHGVQQSPNSSG